MHIRQTLPHIGNSTYDTWSVLRNIAKKTKLLTQAFTSIQEKYYFCYVIISQKILCCFQSRKYLLLVDLALLANF